MITRLTDLDVVSNNLANVNTNGYKANRTNFQELLGRVIQRDGIKNVSTQALMQQGAIHQSNNPLDWAIQGDGFFQVRLKDGRTGYTRDGGFVLDANRNLVTATGEKVIWNGQIPEGYLDLSIRPDGTVEAAMQDGTRQVCGTLQLARFVNPTGLQGSGNNIWLETAPSGKPIVAAPSTNNMGVANTHQVEASTVDLSREMTQMMIDQRTFQLSVKAFQQTDQMISQAINLRRG
jgi:flagellar basal-body rod protein FlgG